MDDVIDFLRAFADDYRDARRAQYVEPDDVVIRMRRAGEARYGYLPVHGGQGGDTGDPVYVAASQRQVSTEVHAVARYDNVEPAFYDWLDNGETRTELDLYRAWMGDAEPRRRGTAMRITLFVLRRETGLRIVADYRVCSGCFGVGCRSCEDIGWYDNRDTPWPRLGPCREVRRLIAPTDPLSVPAYDAIHEPGR